MPSNNLSLLEFLITICECLLGTDNISVSMRNLVKVTENLFALKRKCTAITSTIHHNHVSCIILHVKYINGDYKCVLTWYV